MPEFGLEILREALLAFFCAEDYVNPVAGVSVRHCVVPAELVPNFACLTQLLSAGLKLFPALRPLIKASDLLERQFC